jgi:hypothetical protein
MGANTQAHPSELRCYYTTPMLTPIPYYLPIRMGATRHGNFSVNNPTATKIVFLKGNIINSGVSNTQKLHQSNPEITDKSH